MQIIGLPADKAAEYIRLLSKIESGDNPNAKAKTSSASGRFQFIKSTWEGLGYKWADVFNDKLQYEAVEKFTNQNARILLDAGCAINFATLYGAHFLGVSGFLKIMRATPTTPITQVTTPAQRKANPTILKGTVKDFTDWLFKKTGDVYTTRYETAKPKPKPEPVDIKVPPKVPRKSILPFALVLIAIFGAAILATVLMGGSK